MDRIHAVGNYGYIMEIKIAGQLGGGVLRNSGESDARVLVHTTLKIADQRVVKFSVQGTETAAIVRLL